MNRTFARFRKSKSLRVGLLATMSAGAVVVLSPSTASAALPRCTTTNTVTSTYNSEHYDVPVAADGWSNCALGKSSSYNPAARALQAALNRCNGFSLAVDGIYGTGTANAVKSIQSRTGLSQDGVYGPATARNMMWWSKITDGRTSSFRCGYFE